MPSFAPRIASCGCVVPVGQRCQHQRQRDRERKARHDATRPTARQRGYDRTWDEARADYLKVNRICIMCGDPATHVDHKIPHRGDKRLFWDRRNWQPLCEHHHNSWKQSQERRANRGVSQNFTASTGTGGGGETQR